VVSFRRETLPTLRSTALPASACDGYGSSLAAVNAAARAGSRPNARALPTWST
jgi:hypothetical protein